MDGRVKGLRRVQPLLDLDTNNPCITADIKVLVLHVSQSVGEVQNRAIRKPDVKLPIAEADVKLAFLPTNEGEVSLCELITPAPARQGVEDNGVGVKTRVEVHRNVFRIMTNVDGKGAAAVLGLDADLELLPLPECHVSHFL